MYYNGQYYNANTLSEAMTQHDISNHRPPLHRAEAITSSVIRHIFMLPAYLIAAVTIYLLVGSALFG